MGKTDQGIDCEVAMIGNNPKTRRYFDSTRAVQWEVRDINNDGLIKVIGRYEGNRICRYFFRLLDKSDHRKKLNEVKNDILAELSVIEHERLYGNN